MAKDRLPVPETLVLKAEARVMAVRNDAAQRWVNGSLGTVARLADDRVWVQLDDGFEAEIERATWEHIRYTWNNATSRVEAIVVGKYKQLPLIHAWASTAHKAQGLTLDDVRIDFDLGAFAPGQVYVALSRARSMAGLSLARPLRSTDVRIDRRITAFMAAFESDDPSGRLMQNNRNGDFMTLMTPAGALWRRQEVMLSLMCSPPWSTSSRARRRMRGYRLKLGMKNGHRLDLLKR